ncbi:MAG TPA: proline racemase family protein [Pirellulaceae bacterium]|nr:proline racemase family protein [Pirellulaceae bacterium]
MTHNLSMRDVAFVDSHTGGEPTRVIVSGAPDLGIGDLAERRGRFAQNHDDFRRDVILEPRGSDILVGALLLEPVDSQSAAATIFFNNVGCLGMCGHGTIGLMATLAYLNRIQPGYHRIETPVGSVETMLHDRNRVSVTNVPSYRFRHGVALDVPDVGQVSGDIAYGGNWFYLVELPGEEISLRRLDRLMGIAVSIRRMLDHLKIRSENGQLIDHIELSSGDRNFVLCPGGAYDRSPCGTGTSAKVACLAAEGRLAEGETWRQVSVTGSSFEAVYARSHGQRGVIPTITGTAFVTAEGRLLFDERDDLRKL